MAVQEIDLKKKNEIADQILREVQAENTKAEVEKAFGEGDQNYINVYLRK